MYIQNKLTAHQNFFDGLNYYSKKKYPFITKLIKPDNRDFLDKWISEVGQEKANLIKNISIDLLNDFRIFCINYLKGQILDECVFDYHFQCLIGDFLTYYKGFEILKYSQTFCNYELKYQCKSDLIIEMHDQAHLFLFKATRSNKYRSDIDNYLLEIVSSMVAFNSWIKYDAITSGSLIYVAVDDSVGYEIKIDSKSYVYYKEKLLKVLNNGS